MQWFYSDGNKPLGPLTEAEFQTLAKAGTIRPDTLVWREGLPQWLPFRELKPVAAPPPVGPSTVQCVECRGRFPLDEVIRYEEQFICAACKPRFFQKLEEGVLAVGQGLWRDGKVLVLNSAVELPDRCVKCNAPAGGYRLKRNLRWHSPWIYLVILINLIIYAIVATLACRRATIHIGLCPAHRARRARQMAFATISIVAGVVLFLAALGNPLSGTNPGWFVLGALVMLIVGTVFGIRASQVSARKIDGPYVHVQGVGRDFLASLPAWKGRP